MTAQNEKNLLPKEKLNLPKEPLDMPSSATHETHQNIPSEEIHPNDVKTILSWIAPGRPFKKRGRQYYLTSLLIMVLIELILFLFHQTALMALVGSVVFLAFALNSIAPKNFHYRISTEGITIDDHFFLWQELYDFYFKKQHGLDIVHIRTHAFLPGELTLTLGDLHKQQIKSALLPFLPYRELVRPTFMEKSGDWLARNFPLDKSDLPLKQPS